jgi:apolipoprotein N-acyltransferase
MLYRALADLVLILHLLFILFVIGGGFLTLRWRWLVWLHLPCAVWGGLVELAGWYCPLTPLENELRRAGGATGYSGSFVAHYLLPLIYPIGLTRGVQLALAAVVLLVNGAAYVLYFRRRRSRRPFP